ncbi:MAG TPA: hypothetical protein VJL89_07815 [Thermodesulfovibrionia bacterium]|nr:hypothetical protein [Thermodesulfovibrionia bacterium]
MDKQVKEKSVIKESNFDKIQNIISDLQLPGLKAFDEDGTIYIQGHLQDSGQRRILTARLQDANVAAKVHVWLDSEIIMQVKEVMKALHGLNLSILNRGHGRLELRGNVKDCYRFPRLLTTLKQDVPGIQSIELLVDGEVTQKEKTEWEETKQFILNQFSDFVTLTDHVTLKEEAVKEEAVKEEEVKADDTEKEVSNVEKNAQPAQKPVQEKDKLNKPEPKESAPDSAEKEEEPAQDNDENDKGQ